MRKPRTILATATFLTFIAASAAPLLAQSDAARVQGVITDQSGALVPGAKVKVASVTTDRVLETSSAEAGSRSFPIPPPGDYVHEVSTDGFKPVKQNVKLQVAQVANVNGVLQSGTITEQVVVTEDAALVDSASSEIGTTVATWQIKDLPLYGRNFTQLATLIPGVNRGVPNNVDTGQGNNAETFRYGTSNGASLVVNGARPQANNFTLDGLDNNESLVNTIVFFPSAEAIQEFKVQTNIAPAEFVRARGAIVNTTIKSGGNEIHGSAFEFIRNDNVDARPTFAPAISEFRRNQFGGTVGAPIIKNKLFVFGDYQGFRQSTPVGVDFASVPTQSMRQCAFSDLVNPSQSGLSQADVIKDVSSGNHCPGNVIPVNLQNSVGKNYLNAFPTPNMAGKVQQNYVSQRQQTQKFHNFDVRGDWNPRERDRIFARYSYAHDKEATTTRLPGLPAGFGSGKQFTYAHGAAVGHTHTFSPTLCSDVRLGFQRTKLGYAPPYADEPLSKNLGIPNATPIETPRERTRLAETYTAERLSVWQKRLNLQNWNISILVVRASKLKPDTLGNVVWELDRNTAVIRVLDPADYKLPFAEILQDLEFTVVHELIHLELATVLSPLTRNDANRRAEEYAVNQLADALLKLARQNRAFTQVTQAQQPQQ